MTIGKVGRPLYIVDGYNVVFNGKFNGRGNNIEFLRNELIRYLDNYRSKRNVDIVVVWDGNSSSVNLSSMPNASRIKNLFSRNPENADMKIVKMVAKYEKRGRIIVVSNDRKHITGVVKNLGAKTMSVESFLSLIGYNGEVKRRNIKIGKTSINEISEVDDKLNANDLTVEEWLKIFKSKNKKENS